MYVENPSEWGTKRTCQSCAAKFYDMQRSPVVCPKCQTEFVAPPKPKSHGSASKSALARARSGGTPFGHGQSPWARRTGGHSPFAEARAGEEGGKDEKEADAGPSEGADGQSQ